MHREDAGTVRVQDAPRILLLRVPGADDSGWIAPLAERFGVTLRDLADAPPDPWVPRACAEVACALSAGWETVLVFSSLPARDSAAAAAQLLSAGADDLVEATPDGADAILEQVLARADRVGRNCGALASEGGLEGASIAMRRARKQLARALEDADAPVLILGETGTGKQLAASALHRLDPARREAPFHAVDCGAIVDGLFGSELFGHVQGAFTGAQSSRPGAFASAAAGTLLLDEIGELNAQLQAWFLSALQERRYRPVGSDRDYPIRCRIVAATNRDLPRLAESGKFRPDLFFRLDGVRIELPPLRHRREDIAALFVRFVRRHNSQLVEVDRDVLACLAQAEFSGNVRELESIARHCAFASRGAARIRLPHLPLAVLNARARPAARGTEEAVSEMVARGLKLDEILAECRGRAVDTALRIAAHSNPAVRKTELVSLAAERLGVSSRTIYGTLQ